MSLSDTLENALLELVFRNGTYTPPEEVYVALFSEAPDDTGGGTEIEGDGYARQLVTFSAADEGAIENDTVVMFPPATADWGDVSHSALFDAETDGVMLCWGALTASRNVADSEIFLFPVGSIRVTLD